VKAEHTLILAVALPLLGISAGIVRGELHRGESRRFVLAIHGYDPRDLLHGQYLQYRLDLQEPDGARVCEDDDDDCGLCLTRGDDDAKPPSVRRALLSVERPVCNAVLLTRYLPRLQRFYIPEARAAELSQKLLTSAARDDARVLVAIDRDGVPSAEALLLGDEEVR
jgi:uncharacterized membrane-anchored protein